MKIQHNILVSLFMACAAVASATTAKWVVNPGFVKINRIASDMFVAHQARHVGVLGTDGRWVVPATADSITEFNEGYSLVMTLNDNGEYRLLSILDEDKHVTPITEDYVVGEYPFFSEGLLGVYYKGKAGYIDPSGKVVVPFKFGAPQPFSEGLAVVAKVGGLKGTLRDVGKRLGVGESSNQPMTFINTSGKELKLAKSIGDINFATTFRGGEALVRNKAGEFYFINTAGKILRNHKTGEFVLDKKGAVASIYPSQESSIDGYRDNVELFKEESLFGYRQNGTTILPAQFSHANEFINNVAAVSVGNTWGIIGLVDGEVKVNLEVVDKEISDTSMVMTSADIQLPDQLRNLDMDLEVTTANGKRMTGVELEPTSSGHFKVEFQFPKQKGNILVSDRGLTVWDLSMYPGGFDTELPAEEAVSFTFFGNEAKANSKDTATITVTLKNNSKKQLKQPVKVKGAYTGTKTVNLAPGASTKIQLGFAKVLKKEVRTVTITVGECSTSRKITLVPFFTEL